MEGRMKVVAAVETSPAPPSMPKRNGGSPPRRSGETRRDPVGRKQATLATVLKAEQEWEEF